MKLVVRLLFLSMGIWECLIFSFILGYVKYEKCICDIWKIVKIIVLILYWIWFDMICVC